MNQIALKPLVACVLATLVCVASFAEAEQNAVNAAKPNVVLVMTDDQGYGDLACHGNPIIQTPNLDRLHSESVRLTDFHVSPCCTPTRAGLMFGVNPVRAGAWGTTWGRSLPREDLPSMADAFTAAGYRTGCFGKWHLGDNYPFRPQDRGFREVLVHGGGGVGQTPDYWGNDYFDDTYFHNGQPKKYTGYCTDVWFDEAMKFIEANRNQPFFVYLSTNAPHGPYHVPERYAELYRGRPNVPNANFWGMITNIDENMGRLMKRLDELGLADNTVLIFMTDNGTSAGFRGDKGFNAGMTGTKGSLFEGGHRVPCFIRWPAGGLSGGRDIGALTAHLDMMPTLIDLCGLVKPAGESLDGISLAPLLCGEMESLPDREIVVQYRQSAAPPQKGQAAVLTESWRLIGGTQLFDIEADPAQRHNAAAENPDVVARLNEAYETWWADVSGRFDEYCEIILGADEENPARLTAFDWHTSTPWNQTHILKAQPANGFWAVEVAHSGTYEVALRRWPEEMDCPINGSVPGGKAIHAVQARLTIAGVDETKPVREDAAAITFRVELPAGKTNLQTWLIDDESKPLCGAYYVAVRRLP